MNDNRAVQSLLDTLSATLDEAHHCHVPDAPLEPADHLIAPLTHYGFLATEGPDSTKFLQGQLTCNIAEVTAEHSREGAYCSPKGRMLGSFRIARLSDELLLMRLRRDGVAALQQALAKYIVFSKADQRDASDDYLGLGLSGDRARENIAVVFGGLPEGQNGQIQHDGSLAIQLDAEGSRFECWLAAGQVAELWPRLSQGLTVQGSRTWELLTIRAGLGEISATTVDEFLPQMLNLQTLGAISFNKGCYTGQEVVARMHYKGAVKRRLYRIRVPEAAVEAGTTLYQPDRDKEIGTVVNAVPLVDGGSEALAVITIKDADAGQVVAGENHAAVEVLSLPYAITN